MLGMHRRATESQCYIAFMQEHQDEADEDNLAAFLLQQTRTILQQPR